MIFYKILTYYTGKIIIKSIKFYTYIPERVDVVSRWVLARNRSHKIDSAKQLYVNKLSAKDSRGLGVKSASEVHPGEKKILATKMEKIQIDIKGGEEE